MNDLPNWHTERAELLTGVAARIDHITQELDNCSQQAGSAYALKLAEMLEGARRLTVKAGAEALRSARYHTRKAKAHTEGQLS